MDELMRYIQFEDYEKFGFEQILNKKIMITKNHFEKINFNLCYDEEINIINLLEKYGYIFTDDDYIFIINDSPCSFAYIPENKRTIELCKIVVQKRGDMLYHVSENKKTDEICKIAVQQNGYALAYVPENKKTYEICKIAVQQNRSALQFVPENIINIL